MALLRKLAAPALLFLLCLGIVTGRVVLSSRALWHTGQALLPGDPALAVRVLGRAARLYAPGNPYSRRAFAALQRIAETAEAAGDRELAILGFREVRSAALATRSFYTPQQGRLELANARLAVLMAAAEAGDPELGREPAETRQAWHRSMLQRSDAPSVGYTLLALLGAGLLIGAAIGFIYHGVDPQGRLIRRRAGRWALLCGLGLGLMLLGLYLA